MSWAAFFCYHDQCAVRVFGIQQKMAEDDLEKVEKELEEVEKNLEWVEKDVEKCWLLHWLAPDDEHISANEHSPVKEGE